MAIIGFEGQKLRHAVVSLSTTRCETRLTKPNQFSICIFNINTRDIWTSVLMHITHKPEVQSSRRCALEHKYLFYPKKYTFINLFFIKREEHSQILHTQLRMCNFVVICI